MALSHHEQQELNRIAVTLHAEDPRLARTFDHDWTATRTRQRVLAVVVFVAGIVAQSTAVFIPHGITIAGVFAVCVLAYVAMFFAAFSFCKVPFRRRRPVGVRPDDAGLAP
jgi:hypothetical protein